MQLIDCLSELPDDMEMIDLLESGRKTKTVGQLKQELKNPNEEGYEVRISKFNYGKTIKYSIGLINGPNLYNQA